MKSKRKKCSCDEGYELQGNQCAEQTIEEQDWLRETFGQFDFSEVPPLHNTIYTILV